MGNPVDMGILNHFHRKNIYKSGFGNIVVRIGSTHPFPCRFSFIGNTISNGEFLRISVPICAMVKGWMRLTLFLEDGHDGGMTI